MKKVASAMMTDAPMIRGMTVSVGVGVSKDTRFPLAQAFAGTVRFMEGL